MTHTESNTTFINKHVVLLSGFTTTGTNSKLQRPIAWGHAVWWTGTACL